MARQIFQLNVSKKRYFTVTICPTEEDMHACAKEFVDGEIKWKKKCDYKGITFTENEVAHPRMGHIMLCEEHLSKPGGLNIVSHELIHAVLWVMKSRIKYLKAELEGRKPKVNEERVAYLYANLLTVFLTTMRDNNITVTL